MGSKSTKRARGRPRKRFSNQKYVKKDKNVHAKGGFTQVGRAYVAGLVEGGMRPSRAAARRLKCDLKTLVRVAEKEVGAADTPRTPPKSPDLSERRALVKSLHEQDPQASAGEIRRKLVFEEGMAVSKTTVYRDLVDFLGFSCLVRPYCPNCQDERHLSLRIAFALREQGCDPQRIAFTDEKIFRACDRRRTQFVAEGEKAKPRERERWCATMHVFGCIQWGKRPVLVRLPHTGSGPNGGVTGSDFVVVLSAHLSTNYRKEHALCWMVRQFIAAARLSRVCHRILSLHGHHTAPT